MSIRKQAIPLLHLDTGPPVRNPCSSDTVFHADDRIISSISVNQKGYEHLKTNLPQKKKTLFHFSCYLRSAILLFPFCHSVAAITFLILFPSPSHSPFLCPQPPNTHSFKVVEKWRIDWISFSLWEMSLLMWQTQLVPYSSVSLCNTVRLLRLLCAWRHICFPSKSQTERKMSGEYKSISCLFQVFISPSRRYSFSLVIPFLCDTFPSPISPAVTHTCYYDFVPLLCSPFFFLLFFFNQAILHSPYLLSNCLHHHPNSFDRRGCYEKVSESQVDWQTPQTDASPSGEQKGRAGKRESHWKSLGMAAEIKV